MKKSLLFLVVILLSPTMGFADSASFNPVPVTIKAVGGGVPVGTVVAWPTSTNPADFESWLECNGQSILQSTYPELYAMVGSKIPDYRGMFLRGYGSQIFNSGGYGNITHASSSLGVIQGDAIRNMTGRVLGSVEENQSIATGVFEHDWTVTDGANNGKGSVGFNFDASRVVPTSVENRPVNIAVRYLIRAKP